MEGEQEELWLLAVQDFETALAQQGPQEAIETLQSWLAELQDAPEAVLLQLAAAFTQHAAGAVLAAARDRSLWAKLQHLLLQILTGSSAALQQVQSVWQDAAAALLYGNAGEAATATVQRLESCSDSLAVLLGSTQLQNLPHPSTHQQCRSLLACLLHFQLVPPADLPPSAMEALTTLAAPPWFGCDPLHARQQQAAAFEAFSAVVQYASRQRCMLSSTQCQAALDFLKLFRPPLPAIVDLWWGHFAAVLHGIVQQALDDSTAALRRPTLQALLRTLCCQETAHMVVPLVLAYPAYQPEPHTQPAAATGTQTGTSRRKKGAAGSPTARGLSMAAALMAHDVPAFLAGCCELLRPENNCMLQTRIEALAAMERAAWGYLEGPVGQQEGAPLRLWPTPALDQLLFVLRADPSIRVRREAMRLMSSVSVAVGSPQEGSLLRAVVQRCRDRDDAVRQEAYAMLAQFPQDTLERHLAPPDWQAVLDLGLAGLPPGAGGGSNGASGSRGAGGGGGKAASKHAAAIRSTTVVLLKRYLGLPEDDGRGSAAAGAAGAREDLRSDEDDSLGTEEEEREMIEACKLRAAGAELPRSSEAWLSRLLQLQVPLEHGSGASVTTKHLQAAWQEVLCGVFQPDQLAACGIEMPLQQNEHREPIR